MTPTPDLRCRDCRELQLECPQGYYGGACDVCGYKLSIAFARCAPIFTFLHCPECQGSVSYDEDTE